jgi:hypothetical protein
MRYSRNENLYQITSTKWRRVFSSYLARKGVGRKKYQAYDVKDIASAELCREVFFPEEKFFRRKTFRNSPPTVGRFFPPKGGKTFVFSPLWGEKTKGTSAERRKTNFFRRKKLRNFLWKTETSAI